MGWKKRKGLKYRADAIKTILETLQEIEAEEDLIKRNKQNQRNSIRETVRNCNEAASPLRKDFLNQHKMFAPPRHFIFPDVSDESHPKPLRRLITVRKKSTKKIETTVKILEEDDNDELAPLPEIPPRRYKDQQEQQLILTEEKQSCMNEIRDMAKKRNLLESEKNNSYGLFRNHAAESNRFVKISRRSKKPPASDNTNHVKDSVTKDGSLETRPKYSKRKRKSVFIKRIQFFENLGSSSPAIKDRSLTDSQATSPALKDKNLADSQAASPALKNKSLTDSEVTSTNLSKKINRRISPKKIHKSDKFSLKKYRDLHLKRFEEAGKVEEKIEDRKESQPPLSECTEILSDQYVSVSDEDETARDSLIIHEEEDDVALDPDLIQHLKHEAVFGEDQRKNYREKYLKTFLDAAESDDHFSENPDKNLDTQNNRNLKDKTKQKTEIKELSCTDDTKEAKSQAENQNVRTRTFGVQTDDAYFQTNMTKNDSPSSCGELINLFTELSPEESVLNQEEELHLKKKDFSRESINAGTSTDNYFEVNDTKNFEDNESGDEYMVEYIDETIDKYRSRKTSSNLDGGDSNDSDEEYIIYMDDEGNYLDEKGNPTDLEIDSDNDIIYIEY